MIRHIRRATIKMAVLAFLPRARCVLVKRAEVRRATNRYPTGLD